MLDDNMKSLLTSKTVWSAIVSLVATAIAAGRHITISAADQSVIVDMIIQAIAGAGAIGAIWGRSVATKKIGAVLVLICGGLLMLGDGAQAQKRAIGAAPRATTTAPASTCPGDPLGKIICDIEAVKADIIAKAIAAIQEADADAATITNPNDPTSFRDPIAHACYPEQVKFLQSLPAAIPIQSPQPFNLIVLFQRKRDFVAQVKAGLPVSLKLGCSALLGDEIQTAISTLALVGVKILPAALTAIFPAAAPITLPALNLIP